VASKEIKGIPPHQKFQCSCGRSPIGRCVGWHRLTEEGYMETLEKYNAMPDSQKQGWLSPKAIDGLGE